MNKIVTLFIQPNIAFQSLPPDAMGSPTLPKLSSFERENMHSGDSMIPFDGPHGPVKRTFTDRLMEVVTAIASSEKLYDSEELTLKPNGSDWGCQSSA
jgi:hypothetical protein